MPTPMEQRRPARSADRRLAEYERRLQEAAVADRQSGPEWKQRRQWNAVVGWLLAESKRVSDAEREQVLTHLVECARQMNGWSRT